MLRRIGLRWLLPLINLVVYVALIGVCEVWKSGLPNPTSPPQSRSVEPKVSPFVKGVLSANVLALAAGVILNASAQHTQPMRGFLLAVPFVPLFWYPVGRWLDRRLQWMLPRQPKRSLTCDALLIFVAVIALISAVVLIQVIRTGIPGPPDRLGLGFGFCAWFAFGLVVVLFALFDRFFQRRPVTSTNI